MARTADLTEWLPFALAPPRRAIYKRLSANDTGASGGHQAGPYVPNRVAFALFADLDTDAPNPRHQVTLRLLSHAQTSQLSLIYYNNRRWQAGGTRNECRLTGFGGSQSAFQDSENTGALVVVSFAADGQTAEAWVSRSLDDEAAIEDIVGDVEPAVVGFIGSDQNGQLVFFEERPRLQPCHPEFKDLAPSWLDRFPTSTELAREAARNVPRSVPVDRRLMLRHECEFALFKVVEEHHLLPAIGSGFAFVADFLTLAQTTLQRRKARAGRSLEIQLRLILDEEAVAYTAQAETEPGHRPDFIFPSLDAYRSAAHGDPVLAMLAVKSTLRDRWRQVLREADKIPVKHLFTLDQGVSQAQYQDIASSGLRLVVPADRIPSFPSAVRPELVQLGAFILSRRAS